MLLALDTSTAQASIALVRESQLVAELTWDVGRRHSQELLDRVRWLCASCATRAADLTGIAVALGPGSFNGARVAVATAKVLAFALAIPVYGCSTLDVLAYGHSAASGTLLALIEAGRGEVYAGLYVSGMEASTALAMQAGPVAGATQTPPADDPGRDRVALAPGLWRVGAPRVIAPETLAREIAGQFLVCGELREETRAALARAADGRVRFAPDLGGRRASWLAALAVLRGGYGAPDRAATLEPLYLRRPAITLSARHALPVTAPLPAGTPTAGSEEETADALRD